MLYNISTLKLENMKKLTTMAAIAAITFGSVYAHGTVSTVRQTTQTDTTKKKTETKTDTTKKKTTTPQKKK